MTNKHFKKKIKNPLQSLPALSEDKYLEFKNNLNNSRRRDGNPQLPDSQLTQIIVK